jgi:hypothetical protein
MKMLYSLLTGIFFCGSTLFVHGQEDEPEMLSEDRQLYFGLNIGGYLANKYTAPYYAGYNDFTIQELLAIPTIYNQIYNVIQQPFELYSYPENPRYRIGLNLGGHLGYYYTDGTAVFINADFATLRFSEAFLLAAENPANPFGEPTYYTEQISGQERRFQLDLGLHVDFGERREISGYMEIAASLNAVRAEKNEVLIEGLRYNLLVQPNVYNQTKLGGLGYGAVFGTGVRMKFNPKFSFDLGANASFQKIQLYNDPKLKLNPVLYFRILWL